ncbi:MAG: TDP-N-acetylfucosamine:lipid II N-acetylfucosaminyltransferase [Leptothrix sp. (in: b-proteobacteria)]
MRILHLVSDEKFIPFVDEIFCRVSGVVNTYLVIVADATQPLKYLQPLQSKFVADKHTLDSIRPEDVSHDAIIIHYLDPLKIRVVRNLRTRAPIVWSGWGGDYYESFSALNKDIFGQNTKLLQDQLISSQSLLSRFRGKLSKLLYQHWHEASIIRFMKRIDYFSAPIPEDYERICDHLQLRAKYQQINYASLEMTFDQGPSMTTGTDILIGNSASASNNHLEVFDLLKRCDIGTRNVIVPLSYGSAAYRNAIVQVGIPAFGEHFVPLVDFMPLEQYNTLISNCSIVIMGHKRQQAVGNIATMLYKGAKVFLEECTTTFQFLRSRGAHVYSLSDLAQPTDGLLDPLGHAEQMQNAEVIRDFWNDARVQDNATQLVTRLRSHQARH